ncbi:MAG: single-stranded-DNA-specific exonuclease [Solirubrobacterales bacterium]|nr:single-stranded-DNA-specific exonuclease [Solirubrobacterales bacterium]
MPESAHAFAAEPYDYADARAVAVDLDLSEPVAVTLVRRGYNTPELARSFLAADESHPPSAFAGIAGIVTQVQTTVTAGQRITVHGDFDVDGVCATALMVSTLRALGADCDWLIPDRMADGYGLSAANVERLAERGTKLVITVDCGITAVEEVKLARALGMEVVVTDHHQGGEKLPDCPILHPEVSEYPFTSLCGTAVAWKLACALREGAGLSGPTQQVGPDGPAPDFHGDLDLVALATVADVVPLVGENRSLVKRGLAEIRRGRRPGLRALMEASKCEPTTLDESDLAFRLAPRINAAGRLYRADAGVELMLTEDEARAEQIAIELSRANSERRATEREVDSGAEAALRELTEELRAAPGFVVAGQGWHPGVVGIVASRMVERHHRPVVVVSLDEEGMGRGSGRSIPGFDLLAALEACGEHLESFGGHKAAAGLSLRAENLEAFRAGFAAHASAVLGPEDLRRTERIDAMVGGVGLGLELAEELGRLAPFGMGNPGVRLMVPSAKVSDVRTMGAEGKHSRFSLHSGSHRALGVAFGRSSLGVEPEEAVDAAVRLEVNHWNGAVEPRVVLRELYPLEGGVEESAPAHRCVCEDTEWWQRFEAELGCDLDAADEGVSTSSRYARGSRQGREMVRGGGAISVALAELVSSGAGVLAVCADASRRAALAGGASGLARFNGSSGRVACRSCGNAAIAGVIAKASGGLALIDYETLAAQEQNVVECFEHVVLVDPPPDEVAADLVAATREEWDDGALGEDLGDAIPTQPVFPHPGYLHELWTGAEAEFTLAALEAAAPSRQTVAAVFRRLREAGEVSGAELRAALGGDGAHPLSPETAARCFRVLRELELVRGEPAVSGDVVGVVSSEGTELERSPAFRAYSDEFSEARRFLERPKLP